MTQRIRVPCSPEQEEIIVDHFLTNKKLVMRSDERHWMMAQANKLQPNVIILSAELDVENANWILEIETK